MFLCSTLNITAQSGEKVKVNQQNVFGNNSVVAPNAKIVYITTLAPSGALKDSLENLRLIAKARNVIAKYKHSNVAKVLIMPFRPDTYSTDSCGKNYGQEIKDILDKIAVEDSIPIVTHYMGSEFTLCENCYHPDSMSNLLKAIFDTTVSKIGKVMDVQFDYVIFGAYDKYCSSSLGNVCVNYVSNKWKDVNLNNKQTIADSDFSNGALQGNIHAKLYYLAADILLSEFSKKRYGKPYLMHHLDYAPLVKLLKKALAKDPYYIDALNRIALLSSIQEQDTALLYAFEAFRLTGVSEHLKNYLPLAFTDTVRTGAFSKMVESLSDKHRQERVLLKTLIAMHTDNSQFTQLVLDSVVHLQLPKYLINLYKAEAYFRKEKFDSAYIYFTEGEIFDIHQAQDYFLSTNPFSFYWSENDIRLRKLQCYNRVKKSSGMIFVFGIEKDFLNTGGYLKYMSHPNGWEFRLPVTNSMMPPQKLYGHNNRFREFDLPLGNGYFDIRGGLPWSSFNGYGFFRELVIYNFDANYYDLADSLLENFLDKLRFNKYLKSICRHPWQNIDTNRYYKLMTNFKSVVPNDYILRAKIKSKLDADYSVVNDVKNAIKLGGNIWEHIFHMLDFTHRNYPKGRAFMELSQLLKAELNNHPQAIAKNYSKEYRRRYSLKL